MGKKKRSGGGRRGKGRVIGKDRSSHAEDGQDLLSEELTALSAIFQEDFRIVSESPHVHFIINLSEVVIIGFVPLFLLGSTSHLLPHRGMFLRFLSLPGAYRDILTSANFNAREGRVMIFNLVEAAQEFLSDIVPAEESHIPHFDSGGREHWPAEDGAFLHSRCVASDGAFVHGLYDLYSDMSGGSWDQLLEKHVLNDGQSKFPREKTAPVIRLDEEVWCKGLDLAEQMNKLCLSDVANISEPLQPSAVDSVYGDKSENEKRDLILMLSDWGKDLATEPSMFDKAFENAFRHYVVCICSASGLKSRYLNDFEEVCPLGKKICYCDHSVGLKFFADTGILNFLRISFFFTKAGLDVVRCIFNLHKSCSKLATVGTVKVSNF
ncbi:unnamed protein product [Spirodela intermedia]|uniref:Uncharacterized protein n=1 Tax=Spirodela intermedia TaxID=51605 RepID=A0A7I8JDP8_SPIIN|nr:unnamed protein product [Spirodela intermedia]CAA6668288.1 unnamed protein product [Spirodela intermedia]